MSICPIQEFQEEFNSTNVQVSKRFLHYEPEKVVRVKREIKNTDKGILKKENNDPIRVIKII